MATTTVPKEALRALFVSLTGLHPARVIWDGEARDFAGPDANGRTGRLVLNVVARRRIGIDSEERTYPNPNTTRTTYSGHRVITISVKAENYDGDEGFDTLEGLRVELMGDDVGAVCESMGLSVATIEDVRTLNASAGNRKLTFAQMDLFVNQAVSRTKDVPVNGGANPTYIESVETTGEGDLDIAGTDIIDGSS